MTLTAADVLPKQCADGLGCVDQCRRLEVAAEARQPHQNASAEELRRADFRVRNTGVRRLLIVKDSRILPCVPGRCNACKDPCSCN